MASKKEILSKLRILITQEFRSPSDAFKFFDKNGDGYLKKKELKSLIKNAGVNGFLSGFVANKLLDEMDGDADDQFNWNEFEAAVDSLLEEE